MVKPFDAKEVVARIKAVLRRCQTTSAAAESTEVKKAQIFMQEPTGDTQSCSMP